MKLQTRDSSNLHLVYFQFLLPLLAWEIILSINFYGHGMFRDLYLAKISGKGHLHVISRQLFRFVRIKTESFYQARDEIYDDVHRNGIELTHPLSKIMEKALLEQIRETSN